MFPHRLSPLSSRGPPKLSMPGTLVTGARPPPHHRPELVAAVMVANRREASVWTLNQLLGLKKRRNGRTANKKTSEHREKELH